MLHNAPKNFLTLPPMPHILMVEARFYEELADQLAQNAIAELEKSGTTYERLAVLGCFEIPAAISMAIASKRYDGYIGLGCVIRGETTHYDYVCGESARGLNDLAMQHQAPIGYGIITAENKDQATVRASAKSGKNVGGKAARACLDMIAIKKKLAV